MKHEQAFIDRFTGLRNQTRQERMAPGNLIEADNIIVMRDGGLEMRPGHAPRIALEGVTDGYSMQHERYAYWLADGKIYADDGEALRVAAQGIADTELSWAAFGNHIMYAGATAAGWIEDCTYYRPLRLPMPVVPVVNVAAGNLPAGQYQVTQVYRHIVSGLTSPAPASYNVDVPDGSGLVIQCSPPAGYASDVFVTDGPNGTVEKFFCSLGYGQCYFNGGRLGRPLNSWEIGTWTLPAGLECCALAVHGQRLHAAFYHDNSDTTQVYFSQRGYFHLFRLESDGYTVQGRVHQMLGIPEGVLCAGEQAVYLWTEDGTDSGRRDVLDRHGSNPGRPIDMDRQGRIAVWTKRGLRRYPDFGPAEALKFIPPDTTGCATSIAHLNGQNVAIISTRGQP